MRYLLVATHTGGVDRNRSVREYYRVQDVATHTGGVDRNVDIAKVNAYDWKSPPTRVAWIETMQMPLKLVCMLASPPTRVAWIETKQIRVDGVADQVATHTGGVDRKQTDAPQLIEKALSPPTRVTWIET